MRNLPGAASSAANDHFYIDSLRLGKTLHFMEWLGIHISDELKTELKQAENMLERSVDVCLNIAAELMEFCALRCVPFRFNIESVAIRKDEIEASIVMVEKIADMLYRRGLRKINLTSLLTE